MSKFYDWDTTLSKDARIYMIVGAKGIGKTYGIRKKFLEWQDKRGELFLEVARTKAELQQLKDEWASKLISAGDTPQGWGYETKGRRLIRYKIDEDGERVKGGRTETVGYFVSLSELQTAKRSTYEEVQNVLLDEAIIDKRLDNTHRYKPYEWETLAKITDSALREMQGDKRRTRLFLLANAVDLVNPYFQAIKLYDVPTFGYHWYLKKKFLLHYVANSKEYASQKDDSLASIMMSAVDSERMGLDAEFIDGKNKFVLDKKPKLRSYLFGMQYHGMTFGVWETQDGYAYVDSRCITGSRTYALTANDGAPNLLQAKKSNPHLRMMGELYYMGLVRYETEFIRRNFLKAMVAFGVK